MLLLWHSHSQHPAQRPLLKQSPPPETTVPLLLLLQCLLLVATAPLCPLEIRLHRPLAVKDCSTSCRRKTERTWRPSHRRCVFCWILIDTCSMCFIVVIVPLVQFLFQQLIDAHPYNIVITGATIPVHHNSTTNHSGDGHHPQRKTWRPDRLFGRVPPTTGWCAGGRGAGVGQRAVLFVSGEWKGC